MTATVLTAQISWCQSSYSPEGFAICGVVSRSWQSLSGSCRSESFLTAWWKTRKRLFTSKLSTESVLAFTGLTVVALSADLTRAKGAFNTVMGLFATALAIGGVAGPLLSGSLIQHVGFRQSFYIFAVLGTVSAAIFTLLVPETGKIALTSATASNPQPVPQTIQEARTQ
jgi:MFS family permease